MGTLPRDVDGTGQSISRCPACAAARLRRPPRGRQDPGRKIDDLREAVTHLLTLPTTDPHRVGVLGICLGGGYALRAAASDLRVQRVATVAGAYDSPAAFRAQMGRRPTGRPSALRQWGLAERSLP